MRVGVGATVGAGSGFSCRCQAGIAADVRHVEDATFSPRLLRYKRYVMHCAACPLYFIVGESMRDYNTAVLVLLLMLVLRGSVSMPVRQQSCCIYT